VSAARPVAVPAVEVVVFLVGKTTGIAAREEIRAIRHSPRVRLALDAGAADRRVPCVSLSEVLGLGRDTSVDRRVLVVEHWGTPLGLEVTAIEGIRRVRAGQLHALPPLLLRCCTSRAVLGLAWLDDRWAVALDLATLLVERGVEVPASVEADRDAGEAGAP
jgi:hypothetical protein